MGLGKGGARRHRRLRLSWYEQMPKNKIRKLTDTLFKIDKELNKADYETREKVFRDVMKPFFEEMIEQMVNVCDHQRKKSVDGMLMSLYNLSIIL